MAPSPDQKLPWTARIARWADPAAVRQYEDKVLLLLTLIIGAIVGLVVVAFILLTENLGGVAAILSMLVGLDRLLEDGEDFVGFRGLRRRFWNEGEQCAAVGCRVVLVNKGRVGADARAEVMEKCVGRRIVEGGEACAEVGFRECRDVELGDRPDGQIGPPVRSGAKHSGRLTHALRASRRKAFPTDLEYGLGQNGTLG